MPSASSTIGLSNAEALRRLQQHGPNELPGAKPRHLFAVVRDVMAEPMLLLLLAAASVYIVLGEASEAIVISASMLVVVVISIVQERRTERALVTLRELSSPRALVIRDGVEQRIAGRDVVPGDTVILREGDRVPADSDLFEATALSVDESILTGESLAVEKLPDGSLAERQVYSGSLVVSGYGRAVVSATGTTSQIGRIGKAIQTLQTEPTPLFAEVRRIVKWAAVVGIALCVAVATLYAVTRHDPLGGVLAGITLAMGLLPEEFPVVLTIFLAMGAWRLSRHDVLARRMPAIETIGAVTLLAVDKTGTLTENRMRVALIERDDVSCDLRRNEAVDDHAVDLLRTALAASEREAFDPMERAIHELADASIPDVAHELSEAELVREYDLTPQLLAVTHVWRHADSTQLQVNVKGAPETVFQLCRMSPAEQERRLARVGALASDGLRVLGVARGVHAFDQPLPESAHGFALDFVGLLCLADPIRSDVPQSLAECAAAGIRVVMITGDHPGTAVAIARQAGFASVARPITGAELEAMDEETLRAAVSDTNIYARMRPEHKLRLVQAFKANREVVAMTGDGVNDAPALKAAHVGVAMGNRGTDVAREAAAIVLLKDDFASLVRAVRSGRRIYDNLQHAMAFIVAVHVPIAGMGLLPVIFGWPLLLLPLHVLFLEFIIDPACSFVFEADEHDRAIMQRKPRAVDARLFSLRMMLRNVAMGLLILAIVLTVYALNLDTATPEQARATAFATLIAANLALIFINRAPQASLKQSLQSSNRIFWWIAIGALLLLAMTLYVPAVANRFQFAPPAAATLLTMTLVSVTAVLVCGRVLQRRVS